MRRRGFTLVEILVVVLIVTFGFLALLTVYTHNVRHATMTRDQLLGTLVCENVLAEIRDHRYGTPPPAWWGHSGQLSPVEFRVVVQGRPVQTNFEKRVRTAPNGNGSFFDATKKQSTDTIEITVRWVEGTQDASAGVQKEFQWTMDVRREPDLVVPTL